jgi:hypothetical protein
MFAAIARPKAPRATLADVCSPVISGELRNLKYSYRMWAANATALVT